MLTEENNEQPEEKSEEERIIHYGSETSREDQLSIKDELLLMFELSKIDQELAEIDETKGDLPETIEKQKLKIETLNSKREVLETSIKDLLKEQTKLLDSNKKSEAKVTKYDEQKYSAKSNKEYDIIMKTIDSNLVSIETNEKRINEIEIEVEKLQTSKQDLNSELSEIGKDLEDNVKALNEVNEEYLDEEREFTKKRKELFSKLGASFQKSYEKLNKHRKGEAIAIVRNGNCMGCFNSIPPQTVLEIKASTKIYNCQSCGRILIDESLVATV